MKPKNIATLNAIKLIARVQISLFFLVFSCTQSDDLEIIRNELPIDNPNPTNNGPSIDNEKSIDNVANDDERMIHIIHAATTSNSSSQIVYTDIEPDFKSDDPNTIYGLDLNNDGIVDYTLSLWNESPDDLLIKSSPNTTNTFISVAPWYANVVPLDDGKKIYKFPMVGYNWGEYYEKWSVFTFGNCFGGYPSCFYDWKDKNDKFIGLRFLIEEQTHYGWLRMDIISSTQWVIKDYAYNVTPNTAILAGQKE